MRSTIEGRDQHRLEPFVFNRKWHKKMLLPPLLGHEAFDCVANVAKVAGFDLNAAELP